MNKQAKSEQKPVDGLLIGLMAVLLAAERLFLWSYASSP
jgi:hypothetical protein